MCPGRPEQEEPWSSFPPPLSPCEAEQGGAQGCRRLCRSRPSQGHKGDVDNPLDKPSWPLRKRRHSEAQLFSWSLFS